MTDPTLPPADDVLVVDDNPDSCEALARLIQRHGRTAVCVEGGPEALAYLAGRRPALVVLGVMMPGVGGLDVLRAVRRDPRLAGLPVVLYTPPADEAFRQYALAEGATDVWVKPGLDRLPDVLARHAAPKPLTGHVLVVDDNAQLRDSVCRLLRAGGYDARSVADGVAALAAMRADPPALVLLDVSMPGPSGFDVLRAAKADPALAAVPVVMETAGDPSTRDGALRLGAADWLEKGRGWPAALLRAVGQFGKFGPAAPRA